MTINNDHKQSLMSPAILQPFLGILGILGSYVGSYGIAHRAHIAMVFRHVTWHGRSVPWPRQSGAPLGGARWDDGRVCRPTAATAPDRSQFQSAALSIFEKQERLLFGNCLKNDKVLLYLLQERENAKSFANKSDKEE